MYHPFFSVLYLTLTQLRSYVIALEWSWKNFLRYMLLMMALFSFLFMWLQLPGLILTVTDMTDWAVRKLPTLRVHDGTMEILEPKGKTFQFNLKGEFSLFENDFILELLPHEREMGRIHGLTLQPQHMIFNYAGVHREFEYPRNLSFTISPYTLMEARDLAYWILPVYFGFRTFMTVTVFKIMEALFFGTFFFVTLKIIRKKLSWRACCFLSGLAMGPSMIFSFVAGFFIPTFTLLMGLYYGVYFVYSSGAVISTVKAVRLELPEIIEDSVP